MKIDSILFFWPGGGEKKVRTMQEKLCPAIGLLEVFGYGDGKGGLLMIIRGRCGMEEGSRIGGWRTTDCECKKW